MVATYPGTLKMAETKWVTTGFFPSLKLIRVDEFPTFGLRPTISGTKLLGLRRVRLVV